MTRQRQIILAELCKGDDHPSADVVYQRARRHLPRISLGTVYRNLEILARQGQIRKVPVSGSASRFDADTRAHHHVRCLECGRLADGPAGSCTIRPVEIRRATGFDVMDCRLELTGICPECRRERLKRDKAAASRSLKAKKSHKQQTQPRNRR
jgi:Fur family ferric uptake transcriptional regulator